MQRCSYASCVEEPMTKQAPCCTAGTIGYFRAEVDVETGIHAPSGS